MAKPVLHARDHLPGGSDPIAGLPIGSGTGGGTYWELVTGLASLIAYWPLSDTAAPALDLSGNALHLDDEDGTPTYLQAGPLTGTVYPYAVAFNGTSGTAPPGFREALARTTGATAFDLSGGDPFTLEAWVYLASYDAGYIASSMYQLGGGLSTIRLEVGSSLASPGQVIFKGVTTSETLNLSEWIHVAATFDGTTARIYFNGAEVESGAGNSEASGSGAVYLGGGFFSGSGQYTALQGRLAHAAVYSDALTAGEIAAHAAATTSSEPAGYVWTADGVGGTSWEAPTIEVTY